MQLVTTAIIPVLAVLGLGTLLRRRFLTSPDSWRGLQDLTYYIFTPLLLVGSIAQTELSLVPVLPLVTSIAAPVLVISVFLVLIRKLIRANGPALPSIIQGSIRLNTYIGLVVAAALHGQPGIATFALSAAVMVPLVNLICVCAHSAFGRSDGATTRKPVWRELATNPLIQGSLAGLAINLSGIRPPSAVAALTDLLSAPALACGTLIAGAALTFRIRARDVVHLTVASALKLLALPSAAGLIATAFGTPLVARDSIIIICALPAAPSAYVLASRLGGDARLMASITGAQTVLTVATLPLILSWAAS